MGYSKGLKDRGGSRLLDLGLEEEETYLSVAAGEVSPNWIEVQLYCDMTDAEDIHEAVAPDG